MLEVEGSRGTDDDNMDRRLHSVSPTKPEEFILPCLISFAPISCMM